MVKSALFVASLVAGLLLLPAGCTTTVSSGGPQAGPQPQGHPPGHAWGWNKGRPRLATIEGTSIQYTTEGPDDIFLYGGGWYRFSGGVWFVSYKEGGAWERIQDPPDAFLRIPPGHAKYYVVKDRVGPKGKGQGQDDDDKPGKGRGRK